MEKNFNCTIHYDKTRTIIIKEINLYEESLTKTLDLLCKKYDLYYTKTSPNVIILKDQHEYMTKEYIIANRPKDTNEINKMLQSLMVDSNKYVYLKSSNYLSVHTTYKKHKKLLKIINQINSRSKNFLLNFHILTIVHEERDTNIILQFLKGLDLKNINSWNYRNLSINRKIIKILNNFIKQRDKNSISCQVTTHSIQVQSNSKFNTEVKKQSIYNIPINVITKAKDLPSKPINHLTKIEGFLTYNNTLSLDLKIHNINSHLKVEDVIKSIFLLKKNATNYIGAITGEIKQRKINNGFLKFLWKRKSDEKSIILNYHFLFYVTVSDICNDEDLIKAHKKVKK